MENMNQFENEQNYDQNDLSATELTAGPGNSSNENLQNDDGDTGTIDTDYSTDDANSEGDLGDDDSDAGSATGNNMDDDPGFTGRDDE